jgi:hypothetical protein
MGVRRRRGLLRAEGRALWSSVQDVESVSGWCQEPWVSHSGHDTGSFGKMLECWNAGMVDGRRKTL